MHSTPGVSAPAHVAIIMDGNGRWATVRGLPRSAGHRRGVEAVRRVVKAAPRFGIRVLSLFAFSADNWKRPGAEVAVLMGLFDLFLSAERERLSAAGVRLSLIGRSDRLPAAVREAAAATELATALGARLHVRLAIDYSARDAIALAAQTPAGTDVSRVAFARRLAAAYGGDADAADVDLLIRTGGERRLSDFLLWESAYAELRFTPRLWPDFGVSDLAAAIHDFRGREQRFGALGAGPGNRHSSLAGRVREVGSRAVRGGGP
jgi:undecaprenyl diphosphate synthase